MLLMLNTRNLIIIYCNSVHGLQSLLIFMAGINMDVTLYINLHKKINGSATDLTIFNIFLKINAAINYQFDIFTAVRTIKQDCIKRNCSHR